MDLNAAKPFFHSSLDMVPSLLTSMRANSTLICSVSMPRSRHPSNTSLKSNTPSPFLSHSVKARMASKPPCASLGARSAATPFLPSASTSSSKAASKLTEGCVRAWFPRGTRCSPPRKMDTALGGQSPLCQSVMMGLSRLSACCISRYVHFVSPYVVDDTTTNTLHWLMARWMLDAQESPACSAASPTNTLMPSARNPSASRVTVPSPLSSTAPASGTR
mmetsp:Transcript_30192/g.74933  ORF Transcript_30192/g.74933 Transcript_30192/m.74933 type:complete len:219 (+) Transcript_30192:455-1111(+)